MMGYRIEYDSQGGKYEVYRTYPFRFPLLLACALVLFLLLTFQFWPEGREVLRSAMIPGEDAATVQALQNMTQDLKAGASMSDALEAFCVEVIRSGNASD